MKRVAVPPLFYYPIADESPVQTKSCCDCHKPPVKLVKIISNGYSLFPYDFPLEGKKVTAWVCGNVECSRYTNVNQLITWRRV